MKPLLIDIMLDGIWKGQLKYCKHGKPSLIDGEIIEYYEEEELRAFVEEKKPSLKGKPYTIEFSNQRI